MPVLLSVVIVVAREMHYLVPRFLDDDIQPDAQVSCDEVHQPKSGDYHAATFYKLKLLQ